MSDLAGKSSKSRADEIDAIAADWLDRRDRGGWAEKDEAELAAWLDEATVNRITYWRMEAAWSRTERLSALRAPGTPRRSYLRFLRNAAAAVGVVAIGGGLWLALPRATGVEYATSIGGRETVMLPDGSRIELNTDTAIRLADSATARNIWLSKGEAYLQVTHDASRPLTVFVGDRRITDLGTKFVVKRGTDRFEVAVLEGRVSLDASRNSPSVVLREGDAAIASAEKLSVTRKSARRLSDELGWRRGVIVFDSTPLADAAEQVSRYNATKVEVADASIAHLPVTGTVSATDPNEFLRMARKVFGLRAQKVNGKFLITH